MATKQKARPDPKDFQFCKQEKATLVKLPGSINGLDFILEDLTDCKVYLLDHSSQVQIDNCTGCEILIGPVDGPAFFRDCRECKVAVACRQLRTRDCHNVDVSLHVATDPIIESSSGVRFCPWMPSYPEAESQFKAANLIPGQNKWEAVYDFTPPAAGEAPHWSVLAEAERPDWSELTASVVGKGPSPTDALTDGPGKITVEADGDSSLKEIGTGHVLPPSEAGPILSALEKADNDVLHGTQNEQPNEVVESALSNGPKAVSTNPSGKSGAPTESQRTEPAGVPVGPGLEDLENGQASVSQETLGGDGENPGDQKSVIEGGSDAVHAKPGVFGLLVRSVRRLFSRLGSPWRTRRSPNGGAVKPSQETRAL